VKRCNLAVRIRSNRTVEDGTTAIQLVALVTEDEKMQRLTHSLRAMVQRACFDDDASRPPESATWDEYQRTHIQPLLGQWTRKASIADAETLRDLQDSAILLANDIDSRSEAAFEEACLATLKLMLARKKTIPINLACTDVKNTSSCENKILPLFETPMTGSTLSEKLDSDATGKSRLFVVVSAVVIFLALLALLVLRKRIWAELKRIWAELRKIVDKENQYEVVSPLVSTAEGREMA